MTRLAVLFARADAEELYPLAEALGVEPENRDPVVLASQLEAAFLALGASPRPGAALPTLGGLYAGLAAALGVSGAAPDLPTLEQRLSRAWLSRRWSAVPPTRRAALWGAVALPGEAPPTALATAPGPGPGPLAGVLARVFFIPLALFRLAFRLGGKVAEALSPDTDALGRAVAELAALRPRVARRAVIALVGSPSAGKDAALRALFGVETGRIHPVAGTTTAIERYRVHAGLSALNTPGLGDVRSELAEQAIRALPVVDGVLYVLNAEGGVQARELSDFRACQAAKVPLAVALNKVDTLRPADRERYIADARVKLGLGEGEPLFPCAFDPFPQISEAPIGVEPIRAWVDALDGGGRNAGPAAG